MAIVLDSESFPVWEQTEAFHAGLDSALPPHTRVDLARGSRGTLRAWPVGTQATLVALDGYTEELRLKSRGRSRLRESTPDRLSIALNRTHTCLTDCRGVREQGDRLRVIDLTSEYLIRYRGECRTISLEIDYAAAGLRVDAVRDAMDRVWASPLHGLVHQHLRDVRDSADDLDAEDLASTGAATGHLIRALVNSVSRRDADQRGALSETLVARIEDYVRRNLADADLTPARIADVHHISLRYLYDLLKSRGETPAEWVMAQRLEGARRDLLERKAPVGAVAQRWGFRDHSHFTRRFKAAYSVTPSEYANGAISTPSRSEVHRAELPGGS